MRTLVNEARHALRLLRKTPGFSLVAMLTLAIGIGANVAIFSVVSGVLLRPLPYQAPERLLFLWEGTPLFLGLYAVMSYMVTQRYHEIGVRMALGASAGEVQRMVVRQGLMLVGIGLGVGLAASLALARVMASLVNGVGASDPMTLGAVAIVLTLAATLASLIPARAATRVDPMVVLRYE